MSIKSIDFIVLQESIPQRVLFKKILLDYLPQKAYLMERGPLEEDACSKINKQYTDLSLVENYLYGIIKVHKLFTEVLKDTANADKARYENITSIPFAYAIPEAYDKIKPECPKEKENDAAVVPWAHFSAAEGIFVSLQEDARALSKLTIHEHGHYMHYLLQPQKYQECDPTMREVMAIFVQEKSGFYEAYRENTLHSRAQNILTRARQNRLYQSMSTAEQWNFLVYFTFQGELQGYLQHCL